MEQIYTLGREVEERILKMDIINTDMIDLFQILQDLNGRITLLAIELQKRDGKV